MVWARHYKRKESAAKPIVARIEKREEMARKNSKSGKVQEASSDAKVNSAASLPPEKYFVLRSGVAIKNIEELALMLDKMNDSDFGFHVDGSKNDFANWVNDCFGKKDLAEVMRSAKDKKESQLVLLKQLFMEKSGLK